MMSQVRIRPARVEDAQGMIHVHHAAVHGISPRYYSFEILELWSRSPDEARYRWMEDLILKEHTLSFVAGRSDQILGFCVYMKDERLLRALYVRPDVDRCGFGSLLLRTVENHAIEDGVTFVKVNSSLNAKTFYQRNGYVITQQGKFRLSEMLEMDCLKMEKQL